MDDSVDDRLFEKVEAGSFLSCALSPRLDDDPSFRGIRLRAPGRVRFGGGAPVRRSRTSPRVVVCGAVCVDADYLGLAPDFLSHLVLVAVDAGTHRARAGTMEVIPNRIHDRGPLTAGPRPDWIVTQWFNPDLGAVLRLPEAEAEYVVYATLGEHVSNVVRIDICRDREG